MGRGRILYIEDEADIAIPVVAALRDEGFTVEWAKTGASAIFKLVDPWDIVILDLNLPDLPGESILSNLKQQLNYPPVLVLTARASLTDKLSLFKQGCDDYLFKPFVFDELLARVVALLRRPQRVASKLYSYRDLGLNPETHELISAAGKVVLTPKEAGIVHLLMERAEQVVSRREILNYVWGLKDEPNTNFLGVHLFNLRKKMSEVSRDSWLKTVRASGFMLTEAEGG